MDDLREKVIKGLECCSQMAGEVCRECPYANECEEGEGLLAGAAHLAADALSLLKAQEPRVMTLAELWHMEHKPVYLERKNSRLYSTEPSIVLKTERSYIPSSGESYILMRENKTHDTYWACDYNKTWRCWASCPTDEQREAVKWE